MPRYPSKPIEEKEAWMRERQRKRQISSEKEEAEMTMVTSPNSSRQFGAPKGLNLNHEQFTRIVTPDQHHNMNRIRKFREEKGLSQRQLAKAVGTSQQQIHRFETGSPVKLIEAAAIAKALGAPLQELFPEVEDGDARKDPRKKEKLVNELLEANLDAWKDFREWQEGPREKRTDPREKQEKLVNDLLKAGIEVDPGHWTVRILLRGDDPTAPRCYPISVFDRERAEGYFGPDLLGHRAIPPDSASFFGFDSGDRRVFVNREHVIFWQYCVDYRKLGESNEGPVEGVNVYWAGSKEAMTIPVEPDNLAKDDEENLGELENLVWTLGGAGDEPAPIFKAVYVDFPDADGERIHLRVGDIALLEVNRAKIHGDPRFGEETSFGDVDEAGLEEETEPARIQ
jgi:transcriptional regulator with XRE-family HTH domain